MLHINSVRVLLGVAALLSSIPTAMATLIPIVNPSFESPIGNPGEIVYPATGWTYGPEPGGVNRTGTPFPGFGTHSFGWPAPNGENVGVTANVSLGGPLDVLDQQLTNVLTPNTTYTLNVFVGRPTSNVEFENLSYTVALLAGNSVLAQETDSMSLAPGAYGLATVIFTALPDNPLLGQNLRIQLGGGGNGLGLYTAFDLVRLTAIAVPEPASVVLGLFAAVALAVIAIRKRRGAAGLRLGFADSPDEAP